MRSSSNQSSKQDDDEDQEQDSNEVVSSFEPFAVETSIKQHIDDMDDSSYDGPVDLDEIFQVCVYDLFVYCVSCLANLLPLICILKS